MRSYNEWLLQGRVPAAGERADYYRVTPDRSKGVALFREDQTAAIVDPVPQGDIIPREEWDAGKATRRRKNAGPTARVRLNERGTFEVWVGNNKPVIEHLRTHGWKFTPSVHRWCAKLEADISYVVAALEKLGCEVVQDD